jgi:hypothetical protein
VKVYKQLKTRFCYVRLMYRGKLHIKSTGLTNKRRPKTGQQRTEKHSSMARWVSASAARFRR